MNPIFIVGLVIGAVFGAVILIVVSCCVAAGNFNRNLEKWSNKDGF